MDFWSRNSINRNEFSDTSWIKMYLIKKTHLTFWYNLLMILLAAILLIKKQLTHWGRVTLICVSKQTIICPDNGLSPGRRQSIIWTNAGVLFIGPLGTNFSEISIEIITFPFTKMLLKVSSAKWRPFCLGLNVLRVKYMYGTPSIAARVSSLFHDDVTTWTHFPHY